MEQEPYKVLATVRTMTNKNINTVSVTELHEDIQGLVNVYLEIGRKVWVNNTQGLQVVAWCESDTFTPKRVIIVGVKSIDKGQPDPKTIKTYYTVFIPDSTGAYILINKKKVLLSGFKLIGR